MFKNSLIFFTNYECNNELSKNMGNDQKPLTVKTTTKKHLNKIGVWKV